MRALVWVAVAASMSCGRPEGIPAPVARLCQSVGGAAQVERARSPTGAYVSWPTGECLDVTYDSAALKASAEDLDSALQAWAAAPGTSLCFNALREDGSSRQGATRRIHVTGNASQPPSAVNVTINFQKTGEILNADVAVNTSIALTRGAWLATAGEALGFHRTPGVDTVLNERSATTSVTALTDADLGSVAAVYPTCQ